MPKKQTTAGKMVPGTGTGLEHRGFLDHAPGFRPFRDTGLFERIGGQPTVDMLVDLLYEGIADDDQLRPLFGRDVTVEQAEAEDVLRRVAGRPPSLQRGGLDGPETQPRR